MLEPVFYEDLVYKLKCFVGKPFPDEFKNTIKHNKGVGYSMDIMLQTACLITMVSSLITRWWVRPQTQ